MQYGLTQHLKALYEQAYNEALAVGKEADALQMEQTGSITRRSMAQLMAKREDFQRKYDTTKEEKYLHYLEAIGWILSSNGH